MLVFFPSRNSLDNILSSRIVRNPSPFSLFRCLGEGIIGSLSVTKGVGACIELVDKGVGGTLVE